MTDIFDVDNDVCTATVERSETPEPPDWHIELANASAVIAKCKAALESITNSPYCAYTHGNFISEHDSDYNTGVTDGHRYCAKVSGEALASISAFEKGEM